MSLEIWLSVPVASDPEVRVFCLVVEKPFDHIDIVGVSAQFLRLVHTSTPAWTSLSFRDHDIHDGSGFQYLWHLIQKFVCSAWWWKSPSIISTLSHGLAYLSGTMISMMGLSFYYVCHFSKTTRWIWLIEYTSRMALDPLSIQSATG
ncbi:hypothetical protein BT63DRAFT_411665 [Microthyrium microscopicum]|uniref:Uncharacterized protein n=1 Tax=Microthyrium microscopicum TaxID=703497 RepID=A0A6A6ULK1_9PEZI|nr:hypothetical protein BT63DRAFT_411665 [Microthyrium microscopicum]